MFPDLPLSQLDNKHDQSYPLEEDLKEAVKALLRLHFIYDLNVTEVHTKSLMPI